jgi:hypothetical protein
VAISDIDLDGWPDIYAGNDFHENDYVYINQKNKTFLDESSKRMMHTSQYTMGVDVADLTNDGLPEIISMDMLPKDPYILKRSLGEDDYDIFTYKTSVGYSHQYTRNNLQWNRGNGIFSETGMYSGMYATDWSWATLAMDFDNDGLKDIFVANGIPKRMNDIDYVNFVSNDEYQIKIRDNNINTHHEKIKLKYFYVQFFTCSCCSRIDVTIHVCLFEYICIINMYLFLIFMNKFKFYFTFLN